MSGEAVAVVTLGCARNDVDSDQVGGALAHAGFRVVDDPADADCVLVNTCTFIAPARAESIEVILDACDLPATQRSGGEPRRPRVVVIGCMAERHGVELAEALPEVASVVGFADYPRLPQIVRGVLDGGAPPAVDPTCPPGPTAPAGRGLPILPSPPPGRGLPVMPSAPAAPAPSAASGRRPPSARPPTVTFPLRTTPRGPWAYLKIAGGCDRGCTFCTIPSYRGRFASRPAAELLAEAGWLAAEGVKEIVCVSENTTSWGKDTPAGRRGLAELLRGFEGVEGLQRVRLMYLQPAELLPEVLDAMAASPVVAPYYDLSLQHASPTVLARMARSGSAERFLDLVDGIRARDPGAVFRSSFIVGFPGETPGDVEVLEQFLAAARLDWVGFFVFSAEDGTPAAAMPDQVSAAEAAARRDALACLQEVVADEQAAGFVGRTVDVLVEDREGADAVGRSHREAPETDGEVRLPGCAGLDVGDIVPARVTAAVGVDLLAEPVDAGDGRRRR